MRRPWDLTVVTCEAFCTERIRSKINRIAMDANGYESLNYMPDGLQEATTIKWPDNLPYNAAGHKWVALVTLRDCPIRGSECV
jgi:hypothetical protein